MQISSDMFLQRIKSVKKYVITFNTTWFHSDIKLLETECYTEEVTRLCESKEDGWMWTQVQLDTAAEV